MVYRIMALNLGDFKPTGPQKITSPRCRDVERMAFNQVCRWPQLWRGAHALDEKLVPSICEI